MNNGWFWLIQLPVGILIWIFCIFLMAVILYQVGQTIMAWWWKRKRKYEGRDNR